MPVSKTHARTILLIEDDDDQAAVVADWLRTCGHRVIRAASMQAAMDALLDARRKPDVIVLDLDVQGRDGATIIELVRARGVALAPIIIVSSSSAAIIERVAHQIGAAAHTRKPCDCELLNRLIASVLED